MPSLDTGQSDGQYVTQNARSINEGFNRGLAVKVSVGREEDRVSPKSIAVSNGSSMASSSTTTTTQCLPRLLPLPLPFLPSPIPLPLRQPQFQETPNRRQPYQFLRRRTQVKAHSRSRIPHLRATP